MKKLSVIIILGLLSFGLVSKSKCADSWTIYRASYTTSNETLSEITSTNTYRTITGLYAIIVGSATNSGSISIYDSKGSATSQIGKVSLGTVGYYPYNVNISSGLTYTTTGNSNGVTILFNAVKR